MESTCRINKGSILNDSLIQWDHVDDSVLHCTNDRHSKNSYAIQLGAASVGNAHLFLDKIVLRVVSGWGVRGSKAWESLKLVFSRQIETYFLVTFAYATEGGESIARAWLDVNHIARNEFYDLPGLGCIFYLNLTYVWR